MDCFKGTHIFILKKIKCAKKQLFVQLLLIGPAGSAINHLHIDYYVIIGHWNDIIWGSLTATKEMVFLLVSTQIKVLRSSAECVPYLLNLLPPFFMQ